MADKPYFRQLPDFEYVSRLPDAKISDYIIVKNLFKKGELRQDIFQDVAFFTKYQVEGDDRPDNVAYKVYGDSTLDWLVLICNNMVNIQSEWPMLQNDFDRFLYEKYYQVNDSEEDTYDRIYNGVHHYETTEVKNSEGIIVVPEGLNVAQDYSVTFYDYWISQSVTKSNFATTVTNYDYEAKIEDEKRNIYLLKQEYLNVVRDDMDEMMPYKKGSSQYVDESLKFGENIKLYQ